MRERLLRMSKRFPNQKGIDKLAACLRKRGLPNYEEHIQFLRELQSLRSGAAHRKGTNCWASFSQKRTAVFS
jgi:hypothetical protein